MVKLSDFRHNLGSLLIAMLSEVTYYQWYIGVLSNAELLITVCSVSLISPNLWGGVESVFFGFLFPFFQKGSWEGTRNYKIISEVFVQEERKENIFFERAENRNLTSLGINSTVFTKIKICLKID